MSENIIIHGKTYNNVDTLVFKDTNNNDVSFSIPSPVYGVSWTNDNTTTMTRTDDAVGMGYTISEVKGTTFIKVASDFDNVFPYNQMRRTTVDGNTMVYVPSMWFRIGTDNDGNVNSVAVSSSQQGSGNWYQSKAFYYGAYEGYVDTNTNTLKSIKGDSEKLTETVGYTRSQFRTYATNNGTGYHLADLYAKSVLRFLWFIEFATKNSETLTSSPNNYTYTKIMQRANSYGIGNTDDIYNETSGDSFCVSGARRGSSGYAATMVWHGIENFIGNRWEYIDGVTKDSALTQTPITYYASSDYTLYDEYDSTAQTPTRMSTLSYTGNDTGTSLYGNLLAMGWDSSKPFLILPSMTGNDNKHTEGFCDFCQIGAGENFCIAPPAKVTGPANFTTLTNDTSSAMEKQGSARLMKEV